MKKLINNVENVLDEALAGICAAHPQHVKKLENVNVLVRTDGPVKGKVALVSGGGSGHEPLDGGYVGKGMLDAAVAGAIFTSPTPDQIYEAIKAADSGNGVLIIILNYTGDIMNFEMAKDMAEMEGIKVDTVIVNDDVAVENSTYTAGRRGIAGTIFINKIAGAAAESRRSIEEVKAVTQKAIDNVRSMGMALSSCIVPASGKPIFEIGEDEMEIGMGVHGEPGIRREKIKSADEIVDELMSKILDDMKLASGDEVAVLVNGLSSTPLIELYIINNRVSQILKEKGVKTHKTFVGEYMTSLEMAGFSISLLKLDAELKELFDAPADSPALKVL
ncbi:dihydroxyacetone kinase subunit DhaK [Clostridium thailandense]|uniref:dihydroxyacetone kinase subunit DhaK n=1 Tax=Clostridium thailandense TaxID=2794346 RepID=UPI00398A3755